MTRAFKPPEAGTPRWTTGTCDLTRRFAGLLSLLALALLGGGCASTSNSNEAAVPAPGQGIAEFREVTREAQKSVAAAVKSLDALASASAQGDTFKGAMPGFDRALHQLELASVRSRARAEAIMARGQAYFDEWKEHLAGITNQAAARAGSERYNRLHEQFGRVQKHSGEVREQFRPFMGKLREFRARLDRSTGQGSANRESFSTELGELAGAGRRVMQSLQAIATALDDAEAALRATVPGKS